MVAPLIGVIVEAADTATAEFGKEYPDTDIGPYELGDGVQCPGQPERWVSGCFWCRRCYGFDSSCILMGFDCAMLQEL